MKHKPNWQIVWDAMSAGAEVELHGLTYVVDSKGRIRVRVEIYHNGKLDQPPEVEYIISDMPLNMFIKECERFSDEEITHYLTVAVLAAHKANQKRGDLC